MTVTQDAVGPGSTADFGTTISSINWSHTVGSGTDQVLYAAVIVGLNAADTSPFVKTSATYNGVAMTSVGKVKANFQEWGYVEVFQLLAPAQGAHSIVVTATKTVHSMIGGSVSLNGVDQSNPHTFLGLAPFGSGSAAHTSAITSKTGGKVLAFAGCGSGISATTGTQLFAKNVDTAGGAGNGMGAIYDGASSVSPSFTNTSDWWAVVAFHVNAVGDIVDQPVTPVPSAAWGIGYVTGFATSGSTYTSQVINVQPGAMCVLEATAGRNTMTSLVVGDADGHTWTRLTAYNATSMLMDLAYWYNDTGAAVDIYPQVTPTYTNNVGLSFFVRTVQGCSDTPNLLATLTGASQAPQASGTPTANGSNISFHYTQQQVSADISSLVTGSTTDSNSHSTGASGTDELGAGTVWQSANNTQHTTSVTVGAAAPTANTWAQLVEYPLPTAPGAISLADSGSGSEAVAVHAQVALADSGVGADVLTVGIIGQPTPSDDGSAADSLAVVASLEVTDTGEASDILSTAAAVPLTESGAGADALTTHAQVPLPDTGAGAESFSTQAAVPLADSGTGTEALSVEVFSPDAPALRDGGSAAESLAITVQAFLAESGEAAEALTAHVTLDLADSGTVTERLVAGTGTGATLRRWDVATGLFKAGATLRRWDKASGTFKSGAVLRRYDGSAFHPVHVSYPDATNTGIPAGTMLTPSTDIVANVPGQVIDAMDVSGTVYVEADNVIIKNSHLNGSDSSYWCVTVQSGSVTIQDCEIEGSIAACIVGDNVTMQRCNIHDCHGDGIKVGNNCTYENNWLHDAAGLNGQHVDGMQMQGGVSNAIIRHNSIDPTSADGTDTGNAAVFIKNDLGPDGTGPLLVENNLLGGGGYTLFVTTSTYTQTGIAITSNAFKTNATYGTHSVDYAVDWSNNTYYDGPNKGQEVTL